MAPEAVEPTDEELVEAVLRGERERFGDLVERYQGRLVNYLYRLLRSVDDAHELTQEVFVKVFQALDRFDPRYRFSTWIFRVGQNAAIDEIRKRRLRLVSFEGRPDEDGEAREWEPVSPERGPYRDLRNVERGEAIQDAIERLPWEYRELIVLRHFGELSYDDIATLKSMPLGTVKNKLFRGRQLLKEELADYLQD